MWVFLRDGRMLGWRPSYEDEFNPRFSAAVRRRVVRDELRKAADSAKLARAAARMAAAAALAWVASTSACIRAWASVSNFACAEFAAAFGVEFNVDSKVLRLKSITRLHQHRFFFLVV